MESRSRALYNQVFDDKLFAEYEHYLATRAGPFGFRLAETPLFLSRALRDRLKSDALAICAELSIPETLAKMKQAIPERFDAPNMTALPECVQVDFALIENANGELEGKVVELQGFPSLYALEVMMADAWRETLASRPNLDRDWTCLFDLDRKAGIERIARLLTAGEDPEHVAMLDLDPEAQKTWPDFAATKLFFGIEPTSALHVIKRGNKLFRVDASSGGRKEIPIKRIYNRLVFDELEVKKITLPFSWKDDLDVTWCAHPNWYWTWSKYSLPFLNHPAVPKTRFLSEVKTLPEDLSRYVMKPLFSYAGAGVVVDVTPDAVARVPEADRHNFILQEKVAYANAITMPSGAGVKAEVRIMLMADGNHHVPILPLVRLSRGKMLGVDYNRGQDWVGGTVGIWDSEV
ncbi:MAG: hypothetical protein ABI183_01900 [Polyangiaceae bacterium]